MKLDSKWNEQKKLSTYKKTSVESGDSEKVREFFKRHFGSRILMGLVMLHYGQIWECHLYSQYQRALIFVDLNTK